MIYVSFILLPGIYFTTLVTRGEEPPEDDIQRPLMWLAAVFGLIMQAVAGADSGEQSGDTSLRDHTVTSHVANDELTCAASAKQRSCDEYALDTAAVPGNIMMMDETNLETAALCVVLVVSTLNINVHQHVVGTANPITYMYMYMYSIVIIYQITLWRL